MWYTGCEATNCRGAFPDALLIRDCFSHNICGDPHGSSGCVINCRVTNYINKDEHKNLVYVHGDIHQYFDEVKGVSRRENSISFNVHADKWPTQAFFMQKPFKPKQPHRPFVPKWDNVAVINLRVTKDLEESLPHFAGNGDAAGSWIAIDCDNLLIDGCYMPDHLLRFSEKDREGNDFTFSNISITDSTLKGITGSLPDDALIDKVKITSPSTYGVIMRDGMDADVDQ
jgi:hypothetical protein